MARVPLETGVALEFEELASGPAVALVAGSAQPSLPATVRS